MHSFTKTQNRVTDYADEEGEREIGADRVALKGKQSLNPFYS